MSSIPAPTAAVAGSDGLLRAALKLDAVVSGLMGIAFVVAAGPLADWFEMPTAFVLSVGAFVAVYAAFVGVIATRPRIPRAAAAFVIIGNGLYAVASFVLLAVDGFEPSLAGQIITAAQALAVVALAELQYVGLRRAR
jgi:hypothetical protein